MPGPQGEPSLDDAEVDGTDGRGALGDDDDVGTTLAAEGLAQQAAGQQGIIVRQAMVVHEQDVESRGDIAVLEGIVEQDDVGVGRRGVAAKTANAPTTVGIDGNVDVRVLLPHLEGLVADVAGGTLGVGEVVAACPALIAAAEERHVVVVHKQADEMFGEGRLARPAHGEVADGDDGQRKRFGREDTPVEQLVAQADDTAVQPTKRSKITTHLHGTTTLFYYNNVFFDYELHEFTNYLLYTNCEKLNLRIRT